jgi:hypothetical protein
MKALSPVVSTSAETRPRYARTVAYRSNDHVLEAARAEERELLALGREARMRRVRASAVLGAVMVVMLGGTALGARIPAAPTRALHCHLVTVAYEQPVGTPPPPLSWRVCEWR